MTVLITAKRTLAAMVVLAVLGGLASTASARPAARQRGLDIGLGLGLAGCTDAQCSGLDPSAQFRLSVLYRVIPYFSVGAQLGFQFVDPDRNAPRYLDLGWSVVTGPEVRGILPVGPLEAWVGLTFGYMRLQLDSENERDTEIDQEWTNGFGLGFGFGAQYFVHRVVALGLDFWLYEGFFEEYCTYEDDGDPREEDCFTLNDHEKAEIGVVFTFGLTVTFFIGG
jgi:hypothetical protein